MRKLPIGIQSFEDLRSNDYVYVDKTKYIYDLISRNKVYFLSRPRRFGKSLFLSTLEAFFSGKRELFDGLEIGKLMNNEWKTYPVIHISFATGDYSDENELVNKIDGILTEYEMNYGVTIRKKVLGDRLVDVMKAAKIKTGENAVVLIDEYDKPLLANIGGDNAIEEKNRRILKSFYTALKDGDDYLKFAFVTGITKFSKISLFSDVNELKDISMNPLYSAICGVTEKEFIDTFNPEINEMAERNNWSYETCVRILQKNYDGYHFSEDSEGVYNPFSLLNALADQKISNYWFSTGTPTFLIQTLSENGLNVENFSDGVNATADQMADYRAEDPDVIPLFYQAGYLSIRDYDPEFKEYTLCFPNEEVKYGFLNSLVPRIEATYKDLLS